MTVAKLPSTNSPRNSNNARLRGNRVLNAVNNGAPTTTPSAYADTRYPADGTEMDSPSATCGNSPMITNSVVPMANAPRARASMARAIGHDLSHQDDDSTCRAQLRCTAHVAARSATRGTQRRINSRLARAKNRFSAAPDPLQAEFL